uniref:NmrA-like domain-containing protein n=1 Tax=Bionectria ochroleuca TaxID=29856 RepID=A0A8H7NEN5_BIOOC
MSTIFLTGASGYIGGDLLDQLTKAHPELTLRVLVRDLNQIDTIRHLYHDVTIVQGSLDDTELITEEATNADIVLNLAAYNHLGSAQAIHHALVERQNKGKPAYWIQVSGASALAAAELEDPSRIPGSANDTVWDDYEGIDALRSHLEKHPQRRVVDNYVLSLARDSPQVKAAIVYPPLVYGRGRGPINQRSIQLPGLAKLTLERGDISQLIVRLVEKAVTRVDDGQLWGSNGLYLAGVTELVSRPARTYAELLADGCQTFQELSQRVVAAASALGLVRNSTIDEITAEEADDLLPWGGTLFGTNARGAGRRARELLGWKPARGDIEEEIIRTVGLEARQLGLTRG